MNKHEVNINADSNDVLLCTIRPDLVDAGLSIPVGNTYIEDGQYRYRWLEDDRFQILLNGEWLYAHPIDFVFIW